VKTDIYIQPQPLVWRREAFDHPDWIFEIKYDGFRAIAYVEPGRARLVSRKRNVYKSFDELCESLSRELKAREAVLDGEIVHVAQDGRSDFMSLMRRRRPAHFYAFDLLRLDGRDLRHLPLLDRKRQLRKVIPPQPAHILYVDHIDARGRDLFRLICALDLEGIVAKRKDRAYMSNGTAGWVKIKNRNYSQAEGQREMFEAFRTGDRGLRNGPSAR
jgi:bifunctional non-homologous end joining protein LigD